MLSVFFNASVILAGLKSSGGAAARVLRLAGRRKIRAVVSEIVLDEVWRNLKKIGVPRISLSRVSAFFAVEKAPLAGRVKFFEKVVIDPGDAHILASAKEAGADFLVTLDRKHLLALRKRIKWAKIISPGELMNLFLSAEQ